MLAVVKGLARGRAKRKVLEEDVQIRISAWDESVWL
jgi:hypothetical protein